MNASASANTGANGNSTGFQFIGNDVVNEVRAKILGVLTIYPKISPTMLQSGLGPSLSPSIWRPVLSGLVDDGLVDIRDELPPAFVNRTRPFKVIEFIDPQVKRQVIQSIKVPPPPSC